jgi:hypothetical protein
LRGQPNQAIEMLTRRSQVQNTIRPPNKAKTKANLHIFCWWEKPLVVALKHSEEIKHTVLFQEQEAYKQLTQKLNTIHALSLSL